MHILNKIGEEVNRATYSYICETEEDLKDIPQNKMGLGSIAVVLNNGEMKIFIANGNGEWVEEADVEGGTGGGSSSNTPGQEENPQPSPQPEKKEEAKFEVLNTITVEDNYNTITLTKDDNDNDYDLSSVYMTFSFPKPPKTSGLLIKLNENACANISSAMSTSTSSKMNSSFFAEVKGGKIFAENSAASTSVTAQATKYTYGLLSKGEAESITSIELSTVALNNFPKGSVITIEGCRR